MDERPFYVVQNHWGFRCKRCGRVHEFYTARCRPVLFQHPEQWRFLERRLLTDAPGFALVGLPFGEPVAITAREAARLAEVSLRPTPSTLDLLEELARLESP